ncbi:glycine--tRNA ligase subunit beta [Candidatus Sororendozoicomonas aggregata]|uniref:glycine--tRNA ligase subunit beta n=1 Tax=Candidatus Sororendozoicomonas aggregata TaxID=3073239 RepID=UPI002ED2EB7C
MQTQDFLIELGTEELPPKALKKLSDAFTANIAEGLKNAQLHFSECLSFATPRRLAVYIKNLDTAQPNQNLERRGPAMQAAFDADGNPTKAAEGFARSNGVSVDQLESLSTHKGAWLVFRFVKEGAHAKALLPEVVSQSLSGLPIPKRMRWGARRDEFVRPVKWLLMLMGNSVVDCSVLGLKADNKTFGHRFHANRPITINKPADYARKLKEEGKVLADFITRRDVIRDQVKMAAQQTGGIAVIDNDLLDEVTALVEWPVAMAGRFDNEFLSIPAESLVSSMKEHQKYFHVVDESGAIQPHFITVANIESCDPQQVIAGNECVIRPRLSDAKFFFETDKKTTQEARREQLKSIVFQTQLGSVYDKTERISRLAASIVKQEGKNAEHAARAGLLSKSDLVSEMVSEFPDLQGIMGQYYAAHDGEPKDVCTALNEQYMPRFAGDLLPSSLTGCALSIADKIDTITGIFGIGQPPTGSKDPFALRRASIGILRIIIEKKLNLDINQLTEQAAKGYQSTGVNLPEQDTFQTVVDYMLERFNASYQDKGVAAEVINAVKALRPTQPLDYDLRIQAIIRFYAMPEAAALASANKRVSNILTKAKDIIIPDVIDESLLIEQAEIDLAKALFIKRKETAPLVKQGLYAKVMEALATLKEPVDAFFDKVLVNADNEAVKLNRYALLKQLRELFLHVADISLLKTV